MYNTMIVPGAPNYVYGQAGAEAFQMPGPNAVMFLIDLTEDNTLWIKTTDSTGLTSLKKAHLSFDGEQAEEEPVESQEEMTTDTYVPLDDFNEVKDKVNKLWEELHG